MPSTLDTKICSLCGEEKPLSEYGKLHLSPDGLSPRCKACRLVEKELNKQRVARYVAECVDETTVKLCSKCSIEKPLAEFNKAATGKYGVMSTCKACRRLYKEQNAEMLRQKKREYRHTKPHMINSNNAARRAAKLQATVGWSDKKAIRDFYKRAQQLSKETGVAHHVDHIIPLTHPLVCGLHVETNLQVIPGSDNCAKHNKFVPGFISNILSAALHTL